jgi:hypothetical protein
MSAEVSRVLSIDPDAQHLEFRANACRECNEYGPLTTIDNPSWSVWFDVHSRETGHQKFYQLKVERSMGEIHTMPKPKRRMLGQR